MTEINDRPECIECGTTFDPDSSPHPDRCGQCAARWDTHDADVQTLIHAIQNENARRNT
jgi:predicted Zn-ribbon and HTH transcriptional regulator